jgi:hypothetical protein
MAKPFSKGTGACPEKPNRRKSCSRAASTKASMVSFPSQNNECVWKFVLIMTTKVVIENI